MFRSFLFSIKQIRETNFVFLVSSNAKGFANSLVQTQLSISDSNNEKKSSLDAGICKSAQSLRLIQSNRCSKPEHALNTYSLAEAKNNMNIRFKDNFIYKPNLLQSYNRKSNINLQMTFKDLRESAIFESKLHDIEKSVKQEIMDDESHINFALNAISNSPYQSSINRDLD